MRAAHAGALWRIASARMPTKWGMFDVIGFERDISNGTARVETALAIVHGRSDRRRSVAAHPFAVRSPAKCSGRCAVIVATNWKWPCRPSQKKVAGS